MLKNTFFILFSFFSLVLFLGSCANTPKEGSKNPAVYRNYQDDCLRQQRGQSFKSGSSVDPQNDQWVCD